MSSRLAFDAFGRLVCVDADTGHVWLVIGNGFEAGERGIRWLGRTGRAPTPEEMHQTRNALTYRPVPERRKIEPDDGELADGEAIRLTREEQEREPVNLIARAA